MQARGLHHPAGALAFIVASNLYIPCIASISVLRAVNWELGQDAGDAQRMFALAMGMAMRGLSYITVFV